MDVIEAGDIGVFVGLKLAQTGDTLGSEGFPVLLEKMKFPEPVISVAVEPKTLSERDRMKEAIEILAKEDPTFTSKEDPETGQLIISGMGELHLDVIVRRMLDDFKIEARIGAPQVTYRESVTKTVTHSEKFSKNLAGKDTSAGVTLKVEQLARGTGNVYTWGVKKNSVPEEILAAIENAVTSSFSSGIQYGYPCTDVGVTLVDLEYDELTATPFAFEACTNLCFEEACRQASPELLEPVMNLDIVSPKEYVGDAMSQVTQRGGLILSLDSKPTEEVIHGQAPMAKMFGFSTALRSVSQGRATFSMTFSHFEIKKGGLQG